MSSLASRLSKIQEKVETPVQDIDHYSLEELASKQVDFGKTHVGKSFQHMWEHEQGWILWFTQHYAKSTNVKHRLVLKFVDLKVSEAENWNHKVKVYPAENDLKQAIHTVAKRKSNQCQGQEPGHAEWSDHALGGRELSGGRVRVTSSDVSSGRERAEERCPVLAAEDAQHGEHAAADRGAHSEQGASAEPMGSVRSDCSAELWDTLLTAGDIDGDLCVHDTPSQGPNVDHRRFIDTLKKITEEYEAVKNNVRLQGTTGKKTCLFEVFCSPSSRLTQQVEACGGVANRYYKEQTDLMTSEGRQVLFHDLFEHYPEHVWYSPECGPWSAWSNYNQSKSIESWWDVHQKRLQNMPQLALGIVLLRHQRSQGKHFHWEQPSRSNMFRTPILQEVFAKTVAAEFDMCNLGNLRDPATGMSMKKGMTILATSKSMQELLHGHRCRGDHNHQPLEGMTVDQGRRISRTSFSENYPRKFARRIAQSIIKNLYHREKPIDWEMHEALAVGDEGSA